MSKIKKITNNRNSINVESIISSCLEDFPDVNSLKKEQSDCLLNLANGRECLCNSSQPASERA